MKIKKLITTKTYDDDCVLEETVQQFFYDSPKEKENHKKYMMSLGFKDSGQIKENIGSFNNPKYIDFGSYCKVVQLENSK